MSQLHEKVLWMLTEGMDQVNTELPEKWEELKALGPAYYINMLIESGRDKVGAAEAVQSLIDNRAEAEQIVAAKMGYM